MGVAWAAPVHEACSRGDLESLRQVGTDQINLLNKQGLSPLVLAIRSNHFECVEILLQLGANPNNGDWAPLHEAALMGDVASVRALLQAKANPNRREKSNSGTPLHVACFQGQSEIVKLLIKAGASLNLRDKEGYTALFQAKDQGFLDLVKYLKSLGAH